MHLSDDAELQQACSKVYNDWLYDEFMLRSGRFIGAAMLPVLDTDDAVRELQRNVARGFETVFLPTSTPAGREYNREEWKPLWAAAAEAGISLSFHIGTGADPKVYRGPGGAITNHVVSFYGAQTTLCHLVASGVLEDHPDLHVSFVESGGSWLPAVMERMDEAQRQYGGWFLRPKLPLLPSDYVKRQVHVSFQHGRAALAVMDICGVDALMWGSDYPHLEGTYPNTQAVLARDLRGRRDEVRKAITGGNFAKLFTVPDHVAARAPTISDEGCWSRTRTSGWIIATSSSTAATAAHRLVVGRCPDCGTWHTPLRPRCPECWSDRGRHAGQRPGPRSPTDAAASGATVGGRRLLHALAAGRRRTRRAARPAFVGTVVDCPRTACASVCPWSSPGSSVTARPGTRSARCRGGSSWPPVTPPRTRPRSSASACSPYSRDRGATTELSMVLEACIAAIRDAGLTARDIDGVVGAWPAHGRHRPAW